MKKFIIVDTFNGEGYSNSSAEIIEVSSKGEARDYAIRKAKEFCSDNGSLEKLEDRIEYGLNLNEDGRFDDQGAVHFEELPEGIVSITINPDVNEYALHDAESDAEVVEYIKSESEEEELEDCHHLDDEVVIYQKL